MPNQYVSYVLGEQSARQFTRAEEIAVAMHLAKIFDPYRNRVEQNLKRVANLVYIYDIAVLIEEYNPVDYDDNLRSAVVLLHATLEDFLRTVEMTYLPEGNESALNELWLSRPKDTSKANGKDKSFTLGTLAQHRGKTVDEVIRASVEEYLKEKSYSNEKDLAGFIQRTGIPAETMDIDFFLPAIAEMMERRHQIVHRADAIGVAPFGELIIAPITPSKVREWLDIVNRFHSEILEVLGAIYLEKLSDSSFEEITSKLKPASSLL